MSEIKKELKEAKKELFVVSKESVLAHAKVMGITALAALIPMSVCAGFKASAQKRLLELTTEDTYLEEVITDSKGNEQVNYVTKDAKEEPFVRVYKGSAKVDNGYEVTYDLYSGDQITDNTIDIITTYEVPVEKVLENAEEVHEVIGIPVDEDYMIFKTYRDSDKTYIRLMDERDKEYKDLYTAAGVIAAINVGGNYFALNNIFVYKHSLLNKLHNKYDVDEKNKKVKEAREKVKTLSKKLKTC